MFFLVGPFLLFSNLTIMADYNLVTGLQTTFNIKLTNMNTSETFVFPLFQAESPLFINPMTEQEFNNRFYNIFTDTKFFTYD